ncbi:hypothetical protein PRIPAC_89725 [Pristionchus pacificus]|nr:hypothetical protein PRIPAC_89725 [Pristionchus pacificus]
MCGALYAYILLKTRKPLRLYYQNLYYALLAIMATLLNYVVIHSHPTLLKEFLRLMLLERYYKRKDSQEISSVQGSRLDIPLSEHSEFYFRSYRNSW